jgi:hypothetical protein
MTNTLRALILLLRVVPVMHGQVPDAVTKSNADSAATSCSVSADAYVITGYRSTNAGRNDIGVNLVILRKSKDQWMIVAHAAAVPDPATAVQSLRDH